MPMQPQGPLPIGRLSAPLLACMLLTCACGREATLSQPQLRLQPVAFGGEHEGLLENGLGELQAYRLRYEGPPAGLALVAEVIENGKVVATKSFFSSELPPAADVLLGLIGLEPRSDGQATGLTGVLAIGNTTLRGSAVLGEWDALKGPGEATAIRAFDTAQTIDIRGDEPIVVWRWFRGTSVPVHSRLTEAPPADVHSILQVTIRLR